MIQEKVMIDFKRLTLSDKPLYDSYLEKESGRGCEFSFANLYLWGRQSFSELCGHIVVFSQFNRRSVYPYPIGRGDKKAVLDAIIEDSKARGIPCRITGVSEEARRTIEELYPNKFRFHCDEGSFDYVYSIDDLADLKGKKYHGKRNHLNRFYENYPNFSVEPLCDRNIEKAKKMVNEWYEDKLAQDPNGDYHMEKAAIEKAFRDCKALKMDGLVLLDGENVLAVTLGSKLSSDTFDVNFEKARAGVNGAYAAINNEFAKYIRKRYPDIKYLDREEDMGLEGLRKAKRSYYPHHMIEKCWACLLEDGYDY
jgi:hypothetical protein